MEPPRERRNKAYINDLGHITKMATTPIMVKISKVIEKH